MLYVYWVENDDLKTTAWREQTLQIASRKKIWLGNQIFNFPCFFFKLEFFGSNDEALVEFFGLIYE